VGEGEIRRSSINIMEICNSLVATPVGEVSPAARTSAGGRCLSACGNGKSAGGSSLCQLMEEAGRSDIRKDLLQYLHCGHGLHHLRDFRANFVTVSVSMFT
jgi:hypothetical protein